MRAIAAGLNDQKALRGQARAERFEAQATQNLVVSGVLVLILLLVWLWLILRLTGRLSMLTTALDGLSQGAVTPSALPDVQVIARRKRSLLGGLARAVLPSATAWRTARRSTISASA